METDKKPAVSQAAAREASFDRRRHIFGAVLGPICALLVYFIPIADLSPEAHKLLAIVTLVAFWWICEPVPIPVTSLLGPTLCVIFGVVSVKEAFSAFASPMIFLFMGGFLIAKGMMVNGLDKRIAYGIMSMKWVGDNPRRIFLAIGLACMLCSGWISNTATAAMMFPIALGLLEAIREMMAANGKEIDLRSYKYATGLMLMTAYACSIGGVLTPIGTPPNIIMIGFIHFLCIFPSCTGIFRKVIGPDAKRKIVSHTSGGNGKINSSVFRCFRCFGKSQDNTGQRISNNAQHHYQTDKHEGQAACVKTVKKNRKRTTDGNTAKKND